jgi:hypothetical protein
VEVGVAAVDDDVARLEQVGELVDDRIRALAGLHHDDRGTGLGEGRHEVFDGLGCDETGLGMLVHQQARAFRGAVVHGDLVAFATGEVAGEIRAHHRQTLPRRCLLLP